MTLTKEQEKKLMIGLLTALAVLILYRAFTVEKPRTAPLTYQRGAVADSSVRKGRPGPAPGSDPLLVFLARRDERFPGVTRDLFKMANRAARPKSAPEPAPAVPLPPSVPEKTPEEIAAEAARADLSKFRFLGYLTDKDSTLFLSKDGELYLAKSGDTVLKNYKIKEAGKDHVILLDTITRVEVRVELSGGAEQTPKPGPLPPNPSYR